MTMCNMTIEGGARAGMVAPDETTFKYLEGKPFVPRGKEFQAAVDRWNALASDPGAKYDTRSNRRLETRPSSYLGHESRHGYRRNQQRTGSKIVHRRR